MRARDVVRHPGERLRETYLSPLGLSITGTAECLGISRKELSDVVNGNSGMSAELALRLEMAGWGLANEWLTLQLEYNLSKVRSRADSIRVKPLPTRQRRRPKTLGQIPEDAIELIREIFSRANRQTTNLLARHPSIHEEGLDFQLIASLDALGPRLLRRSRAAVLIESHWPGGRRNFESWAIADIALVIIVRRAGSLIVRKMVLLQSKRLYSHEMPVSELEQTDYMTGIARRLIDRIEPIAPPTTPRFYSFTPDSVYAAIRAGSRQVQNIEDYERKTRIPVYYNLYNPPDLPYRSWVPRLSPDAVDALPVIGCRIVSATDVHSALTAVPFSGALSYSALVSRLSRRTPDPSPAQGWRLESFVADELLRCREDALFEASQDARFDSLLYDRTAPNPAAVVITIEVSSDRE
jgi:addiction module HigA family antidote